MSEALTAEWPGLEANQMLLSPQAMLKTFTLLFLTQTESAGAMTQRALCLGSPQNLYFYVLGTSLTFIVNMPLDGCTQVVFEIFRLSFETERENIIIFL